MLCFVTKVLMFIPAGQVLRIDPSRILAAELEIPVQYMAAFDDNFRALKFFQKLRGFGDSWFRKEMEKRFDMKTFIFDESALQKILHSRAQASCHMVLAVLSVEDGNLLLTDFFRCIKAEIVCDVLPGDFLRIVGATHERGKLKFPANSVRKVFTTSNLQVKFFGFRKSWPPATPFSKASIGRIPVCKLRVVKKFPCVTVSSGAIILDKVYNEYIELFGERNVRIKKKKKWVVSDFWESFGFLTVCG